MEVQVIPAKETNNPSAGERKQIRVAGYARVSSSPQEQSYDSQVEHIQA